MTIPPNTLQKTLEPYPDTKDLRKTDGTLDSRIPYTEAYGKAVRSEIEAVCSPSGKIRYFRMLPVEMRPPEDVEREERDNGKSTAFAQTNMGVFREQVRQVVVEEYLGFRYAVESKDFVGHVYTHCALR